MSITLPWAKPSFGGREREYLVAALDSTWISGGPYVERLERDLEREFGVEHVIATSNGTTALHLALLGLGIGPGDEVILPDFTFVAPGNMVLAVGAKPVFADIDPDTWCIDPVDVERRITKATRAILAVHVYGNMCAMDALRDLADRRGLLLIEDAAEAAFSRYQGRCAGTLSDVGSFSFHATKTITTGEGGAVAVRDRALAEKLRTIRDHGMRRGRRYWHDVVGYNFRMTNMQAALGCAQVERLPEILRAKRRVASSYRARLSGQRGITCQAIRDGVDPVIWAVVVKLDRKAFPLTRDEVIARLLEQGIETRPGFYPFSEMPLYAAERRPVAAAVSGQLISPPSYGDLDDAQIEAVCTALLGLRSAA